MTVINSLASALLMYSRIPVPRVEWKEENRRYALCFFPLIGAVIGGLLMLWHYICGILSIGVILRGAVSVLIPVLITGGIHIDGFCDTADALASYADRQKRLEIMSDPHIGSFAAIGLCVMLLLQSGLFCETESFTGTAVIAAGYVLSRSLSALAAVTFKSAKKEGSLQSFVRPAHKKVTVTVLVCTALSCAAGMVIVGFFAGIFAVTAAAGVFMFYRYFAYRNFGGITGDTEGWFLQITETAVLAAACAAEVLAL